MNKKFIWIILSVLVWFLIIGGFAIYYIFIGDSSSDQNEITPPKGSTELAKRNLDEKTKTITNNTNENTLGSQKDKKGAVENKQDESNSSNTKNVNIEIKKNFIVPETTEVKKEDKAQVPAPDIQEEKQEEIVSGITILGNVIDLKTDKAIEGVNVSFYTSDGQFLKKAITDKKGSFESNRVKGNQIYVRLQKEHYISGVYKNYSIEELSQHLLFKMDPGVVIKGIVKEKLSNTPLIGVGVELYRGNVILKKGEPTDANGNFVLDAVPQGSIELVFSKLGYSQSSQTLNIEKNTIPSIDILLEKSSSLLIEVVTLGGYVEVPKIRVYFNGSQEAKVYERSILSLDQGKNIFHIAGIDPKYSKLRVHVDGFTFPAEKPLAFTPGQETKVVFEVDKGMIIYGNIRNPKGNPLPNVNIKLYEVFGGGRAIGDDVLKGTTSSDKDGKFMVTGITPGNIEIITSSTVYKKYQKKFLVQEKNMPDIDITLDVENFFTGKVIDAEGNAVNVTEVRFVPIKGDGAFDSTRDRPIFENSSVSGEFRMSGVSEGLYRLSITASGYIAYIEERYQIKEGQFSGNFKLIKGLSVTGDVKTESGAPIVDVEIRMLVNKKESNVNYRNRTDFNGFFAISGLEENVTYKLQVQGKGFQLYEKEILVKSGINNYQIVLSKKMSYSGIILDNNTQLPVQNFQIKIFGKFNQGLVDDSSESFNVSNGQFSIPVNSEVFNMELKAPGYALYHLKNIKITDPIQNHYLDKAGSISIKLLLGKDPGSMKLIQMSLIKDIDSDENKRSVRTDSNGNAMIQNLKPGNYYIRVSGVQGFANYDEVVVIQEEVEAKKNIVLIPGLTVKGRILNSMNNIPLRSGEVYLDFDKYKKAPQKVYLDADGFFEFKNVGIGNHIISVNFGPVLNGKFSQNYKIDIVVPTFVNNSKGVYQLDDILVK